MHSRHAIDDHSFASAGEFSILHLAASTFGAGPDIDFSMEPDLSYFTARTARRLVRSIVSRLARRNGQSASPGGRQRKQPGVPSAMQLGSGAKYAENPVFRRSARRQGTGLMAASELNQLLDGW